MIGICGDNCDYCPRYIATKNSRLIDLEKVKELWVRLGLRDHDFSVEDMACRGCLPENKCAYVGFRICVSAKGQENCGLCGEYPCKLINGVFEKSEKLKSHANKVCTQEEMDVLHKAFFSKKEYFDRIHQKYLERK
jgi:hypothetical protein